MHDRKRKPRRLLAGLLLLPLTLSLARAETLSYQPISQEQAMEMMAREDGHVVVDVRRQEEYDAGHIPGAVLIPNESIGCDAPEALPDYEQIILVYCRSGNRSRQAAQKLGSMGYRQVYEFGGILTWPGETVTTAQEQEAAQETLGGGWVSLMLGRLRELSAGLIRGLPAMFSGVEESRVGREIDLGQITDFYYTLDASTDPPHYQRYRFYTEDGHAFFYHERREGGGWPQTEADITRSGTRELTETEWQTFWRLISGGTVRDREESLESGDAGPWLYLYWDGDGGIRQQYAFETISDLLAFEDFCRELAEAE